MRTLKLIFPSKEYQNQILEYKKEFQAEGEIMAGTAGLEKVENLDEWFSMLNNNSKEETVAKEFVPASTYLAIRLVDNKLIGIIDIRHRLNDYLLQSGGHIGYSVRKSERKKGYAKEMLNLALEKCKDMNIEKVLITCDKKIFHQQKLLSIMAVFLKKKF